MGDENFTEIKTGNGIDRDLAATANDRIKKAVIAIDSIRSAIASLEKTILDLNNKNERLQRQIFWLTVIGVTLAAIQIIQVLDIIKTWIK